MGTYESSKSRQMRNRYWHINRLMILMWRLGLGTWLKSKEAWGQIMVVKNVGRKTGKVYKTPMNYAVVNGDLYCAAGFGKVTDWYRNLMANPEVEIWHPEGRWKGVAEEVTDADLRLPLLRQILIGSGIAARLYGLNPYTMSDESLHAASKSYRLIRIRRVEALTGPGGPGDLAWVWPVTAFVLLGMLIFGRRRR